MPSRSKRGGACGAVDDGHVPAVRADPAVDDRSDPGSRGPLEDDDLAGGERWVVRVAGGGGRDAAHGGGQRFTDQSDQLAQDPVGAADKRRGADRRDRLHSGLPRKAQGEVPWPQAACQQPCVGAQVEQGLGRRRVVEQEQQRLGAGALLGAEDRAGGGGVGGAGTQHVPAGRGHGDHLPCAQEPGRVGELVEGEDVHSALPSHTVPGRARAASAGYSSHGSDRALKARSECWAWLTRKYTITLGVLLVLMPTR